jgi:DNA-directed RNA polymerase specialized sigma24 family protein
MTPTQSVAPAWAKDTADQLNWFADDWFADDLMTDRNALVQQFGEDLAHFALLRLLVAQQRGQDILNTLAWCRRVAQRRQWREERQARRYVSMNPWNSAETEQPPEGLWDLVTPERRVIARDLLGSVHMTQDTCGKQVLPSRF